MSGLSGFFNGKAEPGYDALMAMTRGNDDLSFDRTITSTGSALTTLLRNSKIQLSVPPFSVSPVSTHKANAHVAAKTEGAQIAAAKQGVDQTLAAAGQEIGKLQREVMAAEKATGNVGTYAKNMGPSTGAELIIQAGVESLGGQGSFVSALGKADTGLEILHDRKSSRGKGKAQAKREVEAELASRSPSNNVQDTRAQSAATFPSDQPANPDKPSPTPWAEAIEQDSDVVEKVMAMDANDLRNSPQGVFKEIDTVVNASRTLEKEADFNQNIQNICEDSHFIVDDTLEPLTNDYACFMSGALDDVSGAKCSAETLKSMAETPDIVKMMQDMKNERLREFYANNAPNSEFSNPIPKTG